MKTKEQVLTIGLRETLKRIMQNEKRRDRMMMMQFRHIVFFRAPFVILFFQEQLIVLCLTRVKISKLS